MLLLFLRILRKLGVLRYLNFYVRRSFGQRSFVLPLLGGIGWENFYAWEPWMHQVLVRIIPHATGAFVDVGVNVGQTLIHLKRLDAGVPYIGFEPNPACIGYTEQLIATNKLENVKLFPVGISASSAVLTLTLYSDDTSDGSASVVEGFRPAELVRGYKQVPLMKLSTATKQQDLPQVGILKIDVEGSEAAVLTEFCPILIRDRPLVLLEILPVYTSDNTFRLDQQHAIEQLVERLEYVMYRVTTSLPVTLVELGAIGIHGDVEQSNYLLAPRERKLAVEAWFGQ